MLGRVQSTGVQNSRRLRKKKVLYFGRNVLMSLKIFIAVVMELESTPLLSQRLLSLPKNLIYSHFNMT